MDQKTKKTLIGTGKVIGGTARMISGVATATGVGLLGSFLRARHMQITAMRLGQLSFNGGKEMLKQGMKDLKSR
jgi:hypothetical protein